MEKVGEKNHTKKKLCTKDRKFKNTTKATWFTGQLLSSIPNKITQATHNENTKKHQSIQFGTSLVSGIKRWDSSLQLLCSDNVVHLMEHWAVKGDYDKFYKRFLEICWWQRTVLQRDFQSALSQQLPNFLTGFFLKDLYVALGKEMIEDSNS